MPESFSVKAILSAADRGFSSTFKNAISTADSLTSRIKSGLGFGILTGIGQQAFSTISSSVQGVIGDLNSSNAAWKTFQGNMKMVGKSTEDIAAVKSELQDFATKTIYSASDMATTYSQLEAVGIKSTNKLVKGFGGLAAAAENPQQAMKTLSQQATQMAAKPIVAWADFKLMLEQTPAGISAIAKEMGKTTAKLVQDVQAGKIKTEDFFDAISKVGTNDAFTKLATEYKTVDQAADGLKETLSVKLAPAFDQISKIGIDSISGIINKMDSVDPSGLADKVMTVVTTIEPYWNSLSKTVGKVSKSVGGAVGAIGNAFGELAKNKNTISTFSTVVDTAGNVLVTFFGLIEDNADTIVAITPYVAGLGLAFKGYKILNTIAPGVMNFASSIAKLAAQKLAQLAFNLTTTATAQTAVGTACATSVQSMLASAAAFLAIGTGVALAAAGISLLVFSAIQLVNAGPVAAVAVAGLALAIAGLAAGAAILGPTLTAGAVGFVAFGGAIALVGAGALMASGALAVVAAVLPTVSKYGVSGATAIGALSVAMLGFSAGAIAAGAGAAVLAVALLPLSLSLVVLTAGMVALALGLVGVNASMKSIAKNAKATEKSLKSMKSSINFVNSALEGLGSLAKSAIKSFLGSFSNAESKAVNAGKNIGTGITNGVQAGTIAMVVIANGTVNQTIAILNQAQNGAYQSGIFIGVGLANGMQSQLSRVRSIASQLASEAEKAIRAKAKIHSPSRVSTKLGMFWGGGYANGISLMKEKVNKASKKLVNIITPNSPKLAFNSEYSNKLSNDYTYNRNIKYVVEVPLYVDGREFAKATAEFTQEELDKKEKLKKLLKGVK